MNDFTGRVKREEWQPPAGLKRTLVVALDTAQYQLDMEAMQASGSEDVYSTFNLLVRRKPKVGRSPASPLPRCAVSAWVLEAAQYAGVACAQRTAAEGHSGSCSSRLAATQAALVGSRRTTSRRCWRASAT